MSVEKTYHLDLKTLLEYLRGKSATLRATLLLPRNRQPCQGYIFVRSGSVIRGYVFSPNGALLAQGQNAYTQLSSVTEWRVRIETEQVIEQELLALLQYYTLPVDVPVTSPPVPAPRQKKPLDIAMLQMFSSKQSLLLRTVFAMVNGERTVEQIKAQLNFPPNAVEEAFNILRSLGYVE